MTKPTTSRSPELSDGQSPIPEEEIWQSLRVEWNRRSLDGAIQRTTKTFLEETRRDTAWACQKFICADSAEGRHVARREQILANYRMSIVEGFHHLLRSRLAETGEPLGAIGEAHDRIAEHYARVLEGEDGAGLTDTLDDLSATHRSEIKLCLTQQANAA